MNRKKAEFWLKVTEVPPRQRKLITIGRVFSLTGAAEFFEMNAASMAARCRTAAFMRVDGVVLEIINAEV